MNDALLKHHTEIISGHLVAIEECFKPGVNITLLVRRPDKPEQDYMLTTDTQEGINEIVTRCAARAAQQVGADAQ